MQIQVTNLAVYIDSIGEDIVVWANDTRQSDISETAAAGAKITYGKSEAHTNRDGLTVFKPDTQPKTNDSLLTIQYGGLKPFLALIRSHETPAVPPKDRYYRYMYTDRKIYKPTDKIDIFGCIRPRMGYAPLGEKDEICVSLDGIYSIPLKLDAYGCFTVEMPVNGHNGWSWLSLVVNGEEFEILYLDFLDYDNLTFNFDISTGSIGPDTAYIYIQTAGIENSGHYSYYPLVIVARDIIVEDSFSGNTVELMVSEIDVGKLNKYINSIPGDYNPYDPENYDHMRSKAYDSQITVKIRKEYFTKENIGYSYDPIEKRNIERYDTKQNHEWETRTYTTENGRLTITDLPAAVKSADWLECISYMLVVDLNDTQGRPVTKNVYYEAGDAHHYENRKSTLRQFVFHNENKGKLENYFGYIYAGDMTARANESIALETYETTPGSEPQTVNKGKSLGLVTQNRLLKALAPENADCLTFVMEEEWLPNMAISGAYFDGRRIYNQGRLVSRRRLPRRILLEQVFRNQPFGVRIAYPA